MVRNVNHLDLLKNTQLKQTSIAEKSGITSRDRFSIHDKVRVQCQRSKKLDKVGVIVKERVSDTGIQVSFVINLENSGQTI